MYSVLERPSGGVLVATCTSISYHRGSVAISPLNSPSSTLPTMSFFEIRPASLASSALLVNLMLVERVLRTAPPPATFGNREIAEAQTATHKTFVRLVQAAKSNPQAAGIARRPTTKFSSSLRENQQEQMAPLRSQAYPGKR
jgi:hypothetical protein